MDGQLVQGRDLLGRFVDPSNPTRGSIRRGSRVTTSRPGACIALPSVRPNDRVRSVCNFWMPIDNKSAQSPALCGLRGKGLERGFGILGCDGQEGASGWVR
jgi:hypothetical protein